MVVVFHWLQRVKFTFRRNKFIFVIKRLPYIQFIYNFEQIIIWTNDTIDYRIVDEVTDPKPGAQDFCSEQLLYMPRIFSVYDPLAEVPPVAASPCMDSGQVTFGSFNNLAKINDSLTSQIWQALLL